MDPELRDGSPSAGSPSATSLHPGNSESPPAGSPSTISQGGHNNGAQVNPASKEEIGHLLAKLRDVEKMIQTEMAGIKLQVVMTREEARGRNEKNSWRCTEASDVVYGLALISVASGLIGFLVGAKWHENYIYGTLESGNVFEKLGCLTRYLGRWL